jgi:resuscitation-promoting factor RpfA
MNVDIHRFLTAFICGASAPAVALIAAASASADPAPPVPVPPPPDLAIVEAATAPAPAPDPLTPLNAVDVPAPASDPATLAASGQPSGAADGVPHLSSPDALPPGSTLDRSVMGNDGPNVSYLKDLWHAVQNQEISGREALLLGMAQRGMNTPYPDQAPGPNVPTAPADPADPAVAPAPPAPELPWPPPPPVIPLPPTPTE